MVGSRNTAVRLALALLACGLSGAGCARCRVPRIDPSGDRIFTSGSRAPFFGQTPVPPPTSALQTSPLPVAAVPPMLPATPPPVAVMPTSPSVVPPAAVPIPQAAPPAATAVAPPPGVSLTPPIIVAPVGADVLFVAGVVGAESMLGGQRLDWTLDPSGVGQFVALSDQTTGRMLLCRSNRPRKVNSAFAVGRTSARPQTVTRGTPDPSDDVAVQPGQAWITVTSSVEGTSFVTVTAPDVDTWNRRKASARVHWIDAKWVLPAPSGSPAGARQTLTTSVTRLTDGMPVSGWRVHYEILSGCPAGFAPNGGQVIDLMTDAQGNARAEIFQKEARAGTSQIAVQIIRPPLPGQVNSRPLVLANVTTTRTWGNPDIALKVTGPGEAGPGASVTYRIDVTNPGTSPNRGTVLQIEPLQGLTYQSAIPSPTTAGESLEWHLGEIPAGQTRPVVVTLQTADPGIARLCANARSSAGLIARDCAETTVLRPEVDVQITGPSTAEVGENVRFEIVVTNRGRVHATKLVVTDSFDSGLKHVVAKSPIERDIGDLAPGASNRIPINFQVVAAGQSCHRVEVVGRGGVRAKAGTCITATQPEPKEQPQPAVEVAKRGPRNRRVGEMAEFVIEVKNTGNVALINVRVADRYERALDPKFATDGYQISGDELSWTWPRLDVGEMRSVRVRCQCVEATSRACNRVVVTCDGRPPIMDEACLTIAPAAATAPPSSPPSGPAETLPPRLTMSIADLSDPVRSGDQVTYQVQVRNAGTTPARDIRLTVTFPDNLVATRIGTKSPAKYQVERESIRFEAVAEIRPGETLNYLIPFQASQAGQIRLSASLTAAGLGTPTTAQETTEIVGP
jgi:uncharacterized repeat protein (TIGR01451 family)